MNPLRKRKRGRVVSIMNRSFKNNRGQLTIPLIIIGMIIVGFLVFILTAGVQSNLLREFNMEVQNDDSFNDVAKNAMSDVNSRNHTAWDNAFIFLAGFLLIALFLAGATVQRNPVILIIVIITIFLSTYIGMNIVNAYEDIAADTTDTLNFEVYYPKAHMIMSNLAIYMIFGMLLFGIGIYASERIGI